MSEQTVPAEPSDQPAATRRTLLRLPAVAVGGAAVASATGLLPGLAAPASADSTRQIMWRAWEGSRLLRNGTFDRTALDSSGRLVIANPRLTATLNGKTYEGGAWHSPWVSEGFGFTQLIASWKATTPGDTFIDVHVRGRDASGRTTSWDTLARWAAWDNRVKRTSSGRQTDDLAFVDVDTWKTHSATGLRQYQLQVVLYRVRGIAGTPTVSSIGAMTSRVPTTFTRASAPRGITKTLDVPQYSQMVHSGHYPQYGAGGEAWCSPTSVAMVLGYYNALPPANERAWVPAGHPDPWVDHVARNVYDNAYKGCGNWPFNTAYANQRVHTAFVTRLRNLREAEEFIAYGIPLIASVSFARGELDGAPISATNGHLLVIVGFTPEGDVIVNDPAASKNSGVRRVYQRAQFERAWLPRSGGLVYVIRDAAHPVPPRGTRRNW
ncbi:C39 family peptidase [Nocardioides zeae]|uniref:Peptidase C39 family protein n=1 Tax=Nocardioides zeae TaxID=1457234 RepID=A0A6P0HPB3_9ACTN|nr:peptidase C39 family protein [Nocardioides zeae]